MNSQEPIGQEPLDPFEQMLTSLKPRPLSAQAVEAIREAAKSEPPRRRLVAWWAGLPLAAAACLALAAVIYWSINAPPGQVRPAPIELAHWRVQPSGQADYTIIDAQSIRLSRGELLLESVNTEDSLTDVNGLTVLTPAGEAHATGTRFYIGTHSEPSTPHTKDTAMKSLTRVFVLSGVVTLTNPLGSITGQANDLLAAKPDAKPVALAVEANSNFAIDYYKQQVKTSGSENIFFSPYSISTCLMMVQEGARGQTAQQMGKVLGYPDITRRIGDDAQQIPWQTSMIQSGLAQIDARLNHVVDKDEQAKLKKEIEEIWERSNAGYRLSRDLMDQRKEQQAKEVEKEAHRLNTLVFEMSKKLDPTHLVTANAIWVDKTYKLNPEYVKTLAQYFKTGGAYETNFHGDIDTERKRINDWVAQRTQGLITDLLSEGSISEQTRAVLTNTIYFNGHWSEEFDPDDTKGRDFHLANGKTVSVPMMSQSDVEWCRFGAFTKDGRPAPTGQNKLPDPGADGFRVLEMPYKHGTVSMLLIAPEKPSNLAAIESILTPQAILEWTKQLNQTELRIIMIPKFKMHTGYQLSDQLSAMGMPLAFDSRQADFTGMQASPSQDPLYLDQVYHQAFLEVSENGTTAAAATAAAANNLSDSPAPKPEFRADRPFVFMIRDNETGTILFMGRMMDPTAK